MQIVLESDYHAGSIVGLTDQPSNDAQRELLRRHDQCRKDFGRPDVLVVVGDTVDGTQRKGRRDDLSDDHPPSQAATAARIILKWKPAKVVLVAGSGYHVIGGERIEYERDVAARVQDEGVPCEYVHQLRRKVHGWFNLASRHEIPTSSAVNGSSTAIERKLVWEALWSYSHGNERLHLSVFGHRHRWAYIENDLGAAMVLPGWQLIGGSYGALKCDGLIDVGSVQLTVAKKESGGWSWQKRVWPARVGAEELDPL